MKIEFVVLSKESFTSGIVLKIDGFELCTVPDLCWCGLEEKNKVKQQVIELTEKLIKMGAKVDNWEKIKKKIKDI